MTKRKTGEILDSNSERKTEKKIQLQSAEKNKIKGGRNSISFSLLQVGMCNSH